eukprot:999401-Rhodomonas_salina.1
MRERSGWLCEREVRECVRERGTLPTRARMVTPLDGILLCSAPEHASGSVLSLDVCVQTWCAARAGGTQTFADAREGLEGPDRAGDRAQNLERRGRERDERENTTHNKTTTTTTTTTTGQHNKTRQQHNSTTAQQHQHNTTQQHQHNTTQHNTTQQQQNKNKNNPESVLTGSSCNTLCTALDAPGPGAASSDPARIASNMRAKSASKGPNASKLGVGARVLERQRAEFAQSARADNHSHRLSARR